MHAHRIYIPDHAEAHIYRYVPTHHTHTSHIHMYTTYLHKHIHSQLKRFLGSLESSVLFAYQDHCLKCGHFSHLSSEYKLVYRCRLPTTMCSRKKLIIFQILKICPFCMIWALCSIPEYTILCCEILAFCLVPRLLVMCAFLRPLVNTRCFPLSVTHQWKITPGCISIWG